MDLLCCCARPRAARSVPVGRTYKLDDSLALRDVGRAMLDGFGLQQEDGKMVMVC